MRLVTWNTQWCKGNDGVISAERIVQGARDLGDFDVLCLQEISQNYLGLTGATPADQPAEIARLLPGFEVVFGAAIDEQPMGTNNRSRFGNVIASRLPILQVQHLALPSPTSDVDPHPWMPRLCTVCTVQSAWGPVRVMTTHLEYYSQVQRLAQAQALRRWHHELSTQKRWPPLTDPAEVRTPYQQKSHTADAIVCGDFNFEPNSEPYQRLTDSTEPDPMIDVWQQLNPNEPHPPTFRLYDDTYGPDAVSCDFVFVSESLKSKVQSITVDTQTQVSDHQPVCVELE